MALGKTVDSRMDSVTALTKILAKTREVWFEDQSRKMGRKELRSGPSHQHLARVGSAGEDLPAAAEAGASVLRG